MKESYTKLEVVQMLVNNNNKVFKLLDDNKKFIIEGEEVVCYRIRSILPNSEISRYSFDYCIREALS